MPTIPGTYEDLVNEAIRGCNTGEYGYTTNLNESSFSLYRIFERDYTADKFDIDMFQRFIEIKVIDGHLDDGSTNQLSLFMLDGEPVMFFSTNGDPYEGIGRVFNKELYYRLEAYVNYHRKTSDLDSYNNDLINGSDLVDPISHDKLPWVFTVGNNQPETVVDTIDVYNDGNFQYRTNQTVYCCQTIDESINQYRQRFIDVLGFTRTNISEITFKHISRESLEYDN